MHFSSSSTETLSLSSLSCRDGARGLAVVDGRVDRGAVSLDRRVEEREPLVVLDDLTPRCAPLRRGARLFQMREQRKRGCSHHCEGPAGLPSASDSLWLCVYGRRCSDAGVPTAWPCGMYAPVQAPATARAAAGPVVSLWPCRQEHCWLESRRKRVAFNGLGVARISNNENFRRTRRRTRCSK